LIEIIENEIMRSRTRFRRLFVFQGITAANLIWISLTLGYSMPRQDTDCKRAKNPGPVTELGDHRHFSERFPTDLSRNAVSADEGTRYIRVLVHVENPNACTNWHLTLRDENYRAVQTFTGEDFNESKDKWTNRVPGKTALFELKRCASSSAPDIIFQEYIAMPAKAKNTYYSSSNPQAPKYKFLYPQETVAVPTGVRNLGDYVGYLMGSWTNGSSVLSWSCSGVLVAPDLFLTNWHCGGPGVLFNERDSPEFPKEGYWNPSIVKNILIDLSWDDDQISREYLCTQVLEKSEELDFALLRVRPINSLGPAQAAPISLTDLHSSAKLTVIHHPEGKPKQITKDCEIVNPNWKGWRTDDKTEFTHNCDTEAGSSGAPVFNMQGQLIGLHHLGFEFDKDTCLKKEPAVNKAVRIDKIIEFLRPKFPNIGK
jgi:hypothetical protein